MSLSPNILLGISYTNMSIMAGEFLFSPMTSTYLVEGNLMISPTPTLEGVLFYECSPELFLFYTLEGVPDSPKPPILKSLFQIGLGLDNIKMIKVFSEEGSVVYNLLCS